MRVEVIERIATRNVLIVSEYYPVVLFPHISLKNECYLRLLACDSFYDALDL